MNFNPVVLVICSTTLHISQRLSTDRRVRQENSAEKFTWRGGVGFLFYGDHSFKFQPSETNPGKTTFVNEEVYHGPLVWLIQKTSSMLDSHTGENYMVLNTDFKNRVESVDES